MGGKFIVQDRFGEERRDQGIADPFGDTEYPPGKGRALVVPDIRQDRLLEGAGLAVTVLEGRFPLGAFLAPQRSGVVFHRGLRLVRRQGRGETFIR